MFTNPHNRETWSEAGTPQKTSVGQKLIKGFRSILKTAHYTDAGVLSGVHPQSEMFGGIAGETPHGVRYTVPVVRRKRYAGLLPISAMPRISKPDPYGNSNNGL